MRDRGKPLRILGGCLSIAGGVGAGIVLWPYLGTLRDEDAVFAWTHATLPVLACVIGVMLLLGRSRGHRMTLTQERWRYWYAGVTIVAALVFLAASADEPLPNSTAGLSSLLIALAFFILYAPDTPSDWALKVTPAQQRRWWWMAWVLLGSGVVAVVVAIALLDRGYEETAATLMVIGPMSLVFGALAGVQAYRVHGTVEKDSQQQ